MSKKSDRKEELRKKKEEEKREKKEQKREKRKKRASLVLLLLLLLLAGLVYLMNYLGLGFGGGKGSSKNGGDSAKKTEQAPSPDTSEDKKNINVKVSGSDYYIGEEKFTLTELEKKFSSAQEKDMVIITDDGAIQNAMESLIQLLDKNDTEYVVREAPETKDE